MDTSQEPRDLGKVTHSLYMFRLCMEYLSRRLQQYTTRLFFHFHPKCVESMISHLAYVDDLLLFSRGDLSSVIVLSPCLAQFGKMAGLIANITKSSIYMARVEEYIKLQLLDITDVQDDALPFIYLGIPLALVKLKMAYYNSLMDNLVKKIKSWPNNTLLYAGEVQLIILVLQGVECYWISILPLLSGIIERIYSICRGFM